MIGTTVSHYRVLRELGSGGMGVVYEAEDTRLGRRVALKFLSRHLAADRPSLDRFRQEARAASALNHPHICTIYDIDEAEGQPFIAMELLEGEPLRARLAHMRSPVPAAIDTAMQLADALEAAQAKGIVHRDIKPENIFVSTRGAVKLLDFGIAKLAAEQMALTGAVTVARVDTGALALGTLAYMSPEQVRGEPLDGRTDLFSLGVVLYELLTGVQPFRGTTSGAVVGEILTQAPTAPVRLNPEVGPDLERIVNKLLEKDRELRYQSARELAVDLERFRRGIDTASSRVSDPADISIVVLPFENLSPDPDNEFFADGLTEEIITDLSRLHALRVISRSSAMTLKNTAKDTRTLGLELGVRYVLRGTARRAGNQLRVTAQLIEAASDRHLWAERYSGVLDDVFEIQEKLARQIVETLRVRLTADEEQSLAARHLPDGRSFDLYLRARQALYQVEPSALEAAEALVRQAIAMTGPNAWLYALLAHLEFQAFDSGGRESPGDAASWSDAALALAPDCARAVLVKALLAYKKGDMATAILQGRRAVELAASGDSLMWLAYIYLQAGMLDEGRKAADAAVACDPLAWGSHWARAMGLLFGGDPEGAARALQSTLAATPGQPYATVWLAVCLDQAGRSDEATAAWSQVATWGEPWASFGAFSAAAQRGEKASALAVLDTPRVQRLAQLHPETAYWTASAFARVGEDEAALRFVGQAVDLGIWNHRFWLEANGTFAALRGDPRFLTLMERAKERQQGLLAGPSARVGPI